MRVIERRDGTRVQVHDLGSNEVREFRSWANALRFVRRLADEGGLR